MATYKVLQDIEAEDKLFGPFTLKQFIFAGVAAVIIFILFQIVMSPLPIFLKAPLILVFIPPLALLGFMAAPISRDQPNDIWLLARLRFLFKPRTRIWNQDGISELVTITAPKKDTHVYTNDYSQTEVKSRLQALANTVDTRGWAVKNVDTNMFAQPDYINANTGSDRLVASTELPQDTTIVNITAADDIMDPVNNSTAQNLDKLIKQSTSSAKQRAAAQMSQQPAAASPAPAPAQDYWFMNQPDQPAKKLPENYATFGNQQVVQPGTQDASTATAQSTDEEEALARKLTEEKQQAAAQVKDRMKVINPLHDSEGRIIKTPQPAQQTAKQPDKPAQAPPNPAIQQLAQNNDLNIATLARQAKQSDSDNEVVISLH